MTEESRSGDPEMDRAMQLAAEWQQAARQEQERAGIAPDPVRRDGSVLFYSFPGAVVRLWHEPHVLRGRVVGLRPVADGGPQALMIDDLGAYGLRAARPADGSSWPEDHAVVQIQSEDPSILVTLWPVEDSETLVSPAELPAWQVEEWRMRTYRPKEDS